MCVCVLKKTTSHSRVIFIKRDDDGNVTEVSTNDTVFSSKYKWRGRQTDRVEFKIKCVQYERGCDMKKFVTTLTLSK